MEEKSLVTYPAPENMFLLSNEELDICAEVSVKLLAVHSPADFHVIPACLLAKLETITDILMEQDFAGNMENRFPQGELKVETPAACYIDQRWARVEVGTVGALGDCHVKLVDYGLYKFVRTEQLRRLPAQLVIWPPLAYHCRQDSLPTRDLTHAR